MNGGTGAIGSAAVQLLKSLGAHVTAVCSGEHVELVERLGAERVIDYEAADFTTEDQTYDVVFDAAGKSSFGRCKRLLKPNGIYLSTELGPFPQNPILALITPLLGGKRVLFPIPKHDQEMVKYIRGLVESGAFRPVIDRRYRTGRDRRGVPVCRDGPEDRQRRDQRCGRACARSDTRSRKRSEPSPSRQLNLTSIGRAMRPAARRPGWTGRGTRPEARDDIFTRSAFSGRER